MGKGLKKDQKPVQESIDSWTEEQKEAFMIEMSEKSEIKITVDGKEFVLPQEYLKLEPQEKTNFEEKYYPHVIEPSFGIGRIIYCIFEHCFKTREKDAQRTYFDFPPLIAPIKCTILPLMSQAPLLAKVQEIK
jgi:glycyl-tRNA synthetase